MSSARDTVLTASVSQGSRATDLLAKRLFYIEMYYSQRSQRSRHSKPATVNRGQLRQLVGCHLENLASSASSCDVSSLDKEQRLLAPHVQWPVGGLRPYGL